MELRKHKKEDEIYVRKLKAKSKRQRVGRKKDKLEKCDLLEVYKDSGQDQLKQHSPSKPWNLFSKILI